MHDINQLVQNKLELDERGLWVLDKNRKFNYSDGLESEKYLVKVLTEATDVSSNSYELEQKIIDWNSEYHLSRKRAQLLKSFEYDINSKVLEVGCGCGAITRYLGETFKDVVAIEGSIARAEIAKIRTRDLSNISIICAPFQEIVFKEKFDIIFCIGVFEYSNMFVESDDPYNTILDYFKSILEPGGQVVIAIENQFGLKYFSSATEDHSGVMFDGLEGYHRFGNRNAKTFGISELREMLSRRFNKIDFYFPFPDYKMPNCVLSSEFIETVDAGEIAGLFEDVSLLEHPKPAFDEKLVFLELSRNKMLPFFSNSFIAVARKSVSEGIQLNGMGVIFSYSRSEAFQTETRFIKNKNGQVEAIKNLQSGEDKVVTQKLSLIPGSSLWKSGISIHTQILKKSKDHTLTLNEIFEPALPWFQCFEKQSFLRNDVRYINGDHLDSIWQNTFVIDGECNFIDQEWQWHKPFKFSRLLIKNIFEVINDLEKMSDVNPLVRSPRKGKLISRIASALGYRITSKDLDEFCNQEADIAEIVYGANKSDRYAYFKMYLKDARITHGLSIAKKLYKKVRRRIGSN